MLKSVPLAESFQAKGREAAEATTICSCKEPLEECKYEAKRE